MVESVSTTGRVRVGYVAGLDLLRLFAAAAVMAYHLSFRIPHWSHLAPVGWVGVQIFFVISGFVIAGTMEDATPLSFVRARVLRLYPTAWVCAAVSVIAMLGLAVRLSFMAVFDSLVLVKGPFLASAYWTLPVELAFYALMGLLLLGRVKLGALWLASGLIVWSGLYLIAASLHWMGVRGAPDLEMHYSILNTTLVRYGVYFGMGILLWEGGRTRFSPGILGLLLVGSSIACVEIGWRAHDLASGLAEPTDWRWLAAAAISVWALGIGAILLSLRANPMLSPRWGRLVRLGGLATYPLYLLHQTVGEGLKLRLLQMHWPFLPALGLGVLASVTAAVLVVLMFEPPTRKALAAVLKPPQRSAAASST